MNIVEKFYNGELELGMFNSTNENEENVIVEVMEDKLKISTCQSNGWIRINIYHNDEEQTKEEYYEK